MSSTVPYIGSKISLVSNSDIRYEGILYTINTQESTIALQSVRCCGTEGRKVPEIPPSSEIYDFIIFRGQDIKDLTVLESANPALSAQLNDPAIMSVNQRPPGSGTGKGASGGKGAAASASAGGYSSGAAGGYGKGVSSAYGSGGKGASGGYGTSNKGAVGGGYGAGGKGAAGQSSGAGTSWSASGWGSSAWGKGDTRGNDRQQYRGAGAGGTSGGYGGWSEGAYGGGSATVGKSSGGKSSGKGADSSAMKGGKSSKGSGKDSGKTSSKGAEKGSGKTSSKGAGKSSGGDRDRGQGAGRRGGSGGGENAGGTPVGELLPQVNEAEKSKYTEEFDYEGENRKFDKVLKDVEGEVDEKLKPLSGYDKGKSFFDNISCEATERAGDAERPKVDRNKARQNDRETFGDTRRPPRPTAGRRGKGGGGRRGAPRGGYRS